MFSILYDVSEGVARSPSTAPTSSTRCASRRSRSLPRRSGSPTRTRPSASWSSRGQGARSAPGGDVEMAQTMLTSERAGRYHFFGRMMAASDLAVALSKPVVCAVQGACVGGGAEFTTFADLVIADETAYFLFNGTAIGGCSWWGRRSCSRLRRHAQSRGDPVSVAPRQGRGGRPHRARHASRSGRRAGGGDRRAVPGILDLSEEGIRFTKAALRSAKESSCSLR